MRRLPSITLILGYCFLILSCNQKDSNHLQNKPINQIKDSTNKISIQLVGNIEFTRSFSAIQSMTNEKGINRYIERVDKSNPRLSPDYRDESFKKRTELLRKRFEELGFVKVNELLENKMNFNYQLEYLLTDISGEEIKLKLKRDSASIGNEKLIAITGSDSCETKVRFMMGPQSALLDIIPGGNKELVIHSSNYGSNTEFYYFEVYEIKLQY